MHWCLHTGAAAREPGNCRDGCSQQLRGAARRWLLAAGHHERGRPGLQTGAPLQWRWPVDSSCIALLGGSREFWQLAAFWDTVKVHTSVELAEQRVPCAGVLCSLALLDMFCRRPNACYVLCAKSKLLVLLLGRSSLVSCWIIPQAARALSVFVL